MWSMGDSNSPPQHCQCCALARWANTPFPFLLCYCITWSLLTEFLLGPFCLSPPTHSYFYLVPFDWILTWSLLPLTPNSFILLLGPFWICSLQLIHILTWSLLTEFLLGPFCLSPTTHSYFYLVVYLKYLYYLCSWFDIDSMEQGRHLVGSTNQKGRLATILLTSKSWIVH